MSTVRSAVSAPVNRKWYVAASPSARPGWNDSGMPRASAAIERTRRPLRTRRTRLWGKRFATCFSASDPATTYTGSTFCWSGRTTSSRKVFFDSRYGGMTSSPAGQTARQYAAL